MSEQHPHVVPPPSERDPFGMRHQLANLTMLVSANEQFPEDVSTFRLAHQAIRVAALGMLFVGDALGSLIVEVRLVREELAKRRATTEVLGASAEKIPESK